MKLNTIHHIAIIVSDYEKSRDFYVNKLGFSVIRENYRPVRDDWKLDLRINETTELEIFGVKNPPKRVTGPEAPGLRHLAFYAEDLETAVKLILEDADMMTELTEKQQEIFDELFLRYPCLEAVRGLSLIHI